MDSYHKSLAALVDLSADKIPLPPSPFENLEKHPLAQEGRRILYPFLGEMGLEVRGFLGQIEPWLRSGWVIPARRPCLYPRNVAFEDPDFFARVDEIKKEYELFEMVGRLARRKPMPVNLATGRVEQDFHYNMSANIEDDLKPVLAAQRELRAAFYDRYGHDNLVPTKWHLQLSSQSHTGDDVYYSARHVTMPSYLPDFFANPPFDFHPHIGIQLRYLPNNPGRNSDPERMGRLAAVAAQVLNLPVLVYGRPSDNSLPGYARTIDYLPPGTPQMNAELVFLKQCKLMISPDSGWTDLMGWLRVPTLLERMRLPWSFEALRPFRPKILLADESRSIAETISTLCTAAEDAMLLPDPNQCEDLKSNFLDPMGKECQDFWRKYRGEDMA